jgi:hypothetical protein
VILVEPVSLGMVLQQNCNFVSLKDRKATKSGETQEHVSFELISRYSSERLGTLKILYIQFRVELFIFRIKVVH